MQPKNHTSSNQSDARTRDPVYVTSSTTVTSSNTVTFPNPANATYTSATSQVGFARSAADAASPAAGQHGPAFGLSHIYSQPVSRPALNPYQSDPRWTATQTSMAAPSQHGPTPRANLVNNQPLNQTAPTYQYLEPRFNAPTQTYSSDWIVNGQCCTQSASCQPDSWIFEPNAFQSSYFGPTVTRPPKCQVPKFDGNPRKWPNFIQSFKILIHDVCNNDVERITHLVHYLVPDLRPIVGDSLLHPGHVTRYTRNKRQPTTRRRCMFYGPVESTVFQRRRLASSSKVLHKFTLHCVHIGTRRLRWRTLLERHAVISAKQVTNSSLRQMGRLQQRDNRPFAERT